MGYNIGPVLSVGGEAEYNAAMKRVRESMTYVKAEANAAISVFNKNERSMESLTTQIEQSKKALDVQRQAVKAAEDALERMRSNGVDESSTAYKRMEANLNNAKAAMNKTDNEVKDLERDLKKGGNEGQTFGEKIKEFASSSVGQMATLAGGFELAKEAMQALWKMIDNATNAADALLTLEAQTGVAVDTLQEMQYAARFVDVEVEQMTTGLARTVKAIRETSAAGKDYIEVADGVKVSTKDQNGQLKDSYDVFLNAIDAIGSLSNETEKETAAQKLFGKSYQDIMPLVKAGSGAIKGYGIEAKDAGITIDTITVKALGKLDDKLEEVAATAEATSTKTAASMIRVTDFAANAWEDILQDLDPFKTGMEQAVAITSLLSGETKELIQSEVDLAVAADNVAYITGSSLEEVQAKAKELSDFMIEQGANANTAYYDALVNVADGLDLMGYKAKIAEDAQAKLDGSINTTLANYQSKNAQYLAEIKKDAEGFISSMGGIFDAFKANTDITGEQLLTNLKSQEKGITEWAENIDALAKRNIDKGLLDSLRKMGPAAAGELAALNSLSDPKLREYEAAWENMSDTATKEAEKANADMKYNVLKSLTELKYAIEDKEAGMKDVAKMLGLGITNGIIDGLDSTKVNNKIADMAKNALDSAKKKLGIASPSKVFRDEVGKQITAGIALGIDKNAAQAIKAMEALTFDMTSTFKASSVGLSASIPRALSTVSAPVTNTVTNTTREIIRDSGITIQFTGDTHINNGQDLDTIAEGLAKKVKRALAAQGVS